MSTFWTVWFLTTESEPNFGFPHIPTKKHTWSTILCEWRLLQCYINFKRQDG